MKHLKILVTGLFISLFSTVTLSSMSKTINHYKVIFSIIPSVMLSSHPKVHPAGNMHGGVPETPKYHLMLAIIDTNTGKRVKSALVSAQIRSGESNYNKKLEPMLLNGTLNYGNYFLLNSYKVLNLEFTIRISKSSLPFKVKFSWSTT